MEELDAKSTEITSQLQCTCSPKSNHEPETIAAKRTRPNQWRSRLGPSQIYLGIFNRRPRWRSGGSTAKNRLIAGRTRGVSDAALRAIRARL